MGREDIAELCCAALGLPELSGVTFELKSTVPFSQPWTVRLSSCRAVLLLSCSLAVMWGQCLRGANVMGDCRTEHASWIPCLLCYGDGTAVRAQGLCTVMQIAFWLPCRAGAGHRKPAAPGSLHVLLPGISAHK